MKSRLKILLVTPTLGIGGAERVVVHLACHADETQFEVRVASLYDPLGTELDVALKSRGTPTYYLGKRKGFDPRTYPRLASVLRSYRPDVIHTHNNTLRYVYPLRMAAHGARIIHTVHNLAEREVDLPGRLLQHVAFRTGVKAIAIGESIARSIRDVYGLDASATVPNGIPVYRYRADGATGQRLRAELGLPLDAPVFVSVARLTPQKNIAAIIRAIADERVAATNAHLVLVGDGPLRADLLALACDLAVVARVHFLGVRDDVPRVLAAADVAVLASSWEGNPLSVMEAMAAGLPVIATKVGSVPELVEDGVSGRLIDPGDDHALVAAMSQLATASEDRAVMGAASVTRAAKSFDVAGMVRCYERLYAAATDAVSTCRPRRRDESRGGSSKSD